MRHLTLALLLLAPLAAEERVREIVREVQPLVTHEWGTFTSVASDDGYPIKWAPLAGPADLPCFVARITTQNPKGFAGFVRMETPVLYFYSPTAVNLSVHVGFPKGLVTEWYPHTAQNQPAYSGRYAGGKIGWDNVEVLPTETPKLPFTKGASHYYAARETDAAPLRIGKQWEKLIFYRGIGDFAVPLEPSFTKDGRLNVRNVGAHTIPLAILFENQGGKIGYRITRDIQKSTVMDRPEINGNLDTLRSELADRLVEFGLYKKEALAMVETWRDSWFEEGARLFYIVPRPLVDELLPLSVKPVPSAVERVFVGRVELLSPTVRETISNAFAKNDEAPLLKMARFLDPFVGQMRRTDAASLPTDGVYARVSRKLWDDRFRGPGCIE